MSIRKIFFITASLFLSILFASSILFAQADSNVVGNETIEYSSPAAGEVILVWGLHDWKTFKNENLPAGTVIKDGTMQALMEKVNNTFSYSIKLPIGIEINYNFLISKDKKGNEVNIWDDNSGRDFITFVKSKNDTIEVNGLDSIPDDVSQKSIVKVLIYVALTFGLLIIILFFVFKKKIKKYHVLFQNHIVRLIIFIIASRLFLFAIGYLSIAGYNKSNVENITVKYSYLEQELSAFGRADAQWYISIAENGYDIKPPAAGEKTNWAFYPLWPLSIKCFDFIIPDSLIAGILLCNLLFIAAMVVLYKLLIIDYEKETVYSSLLLVIIFPASYFFMRPGNESLFLLLTALTFLFAKKNKWILVGIFTTLAVMTRIQGLLLGLPLFYIYYKQWKETKKLNLRILSLILVPATFLLFLFYLHSLTGDMFANFHENGAWDYGVGYPFVELFNFILHPSIIDFYGWDLAPLSFAGIIAAIALFIYMLKLKSFPKEYIIYTFLSLFLILARYSMEGTLRYMIPIFPLFIAGALIITKRKFTYNLVFYLFIVLQAFYFVAFVNSINWAAN